MDGRRDVDVELLVVSDSVLSIVDRLFLRHISILDESLTSSDSLHSVLLLPQCLG
jgi:hypothetical protein